MDLYIAEKPSTAAEIAKMLGVTGKGKGYYECGPHMVSHCRGHMKELAEPDEYLSDDLPKTTTGKTIWRIEDLPIIPGEWISNVSKGDGMAEQFALLGKLIGKASRIIHAGDADREGQLLVDDVLQHFRCKVPVQRLWIKAWDSTSLRRGLDSLKPNSEFERFGRAAMARSRADWLIGMNLTRAYTLRGRRGGSQALLTVGRVQTPTLGLVVSRNAEVEAFKPIDFFTLHADLAHANGNVTAKWVPREDQAGLDPEGRLVDAGQVQAMSAKLQGASGTVQERTEKTEKRNQPRTFSLSGITLVASNRWGYTAEAVLKVCQALYETHKLTSYPRTDCDFLPESQHADGAAILAALGRTDPELAELVRAADPRIKSPTWDDKKITAHHGIIPTMQAGSVAALTEEERNIYGLIARAYIAQFYPTHEFRRTEISFTVAGEKLVAVGKVVTVPGWRVVMDKQDGEAEGNTEALQELPAMAQQDPVQCLTVDTKASKTKAPARFTEGSLIIAMEQIHRYVTDPAQQKLLRESDGIGTPATRSTLIKELKEKGYLELKGKFLYDTKLGRGLIAALPPALRSPLLTALNERQLLEIEAGRAQVETFIAGQEKFIRDQVAKANVGAVYVASADDAPCPKCAKPMHRLRGTASQFFWACSDREGCGNTMNDKAGRPVPKPVVAVSDTHKCAACSSPLAFRQGKKKPGSKAPPRPWWGCTGYPDCSQSYPDAGGSPDYNARPVQGEK